MVRLLLKQRLVLGALVTQPQRALTCPVLKYQPLLIPSLIFLLKSHPHVKSDRQDAFLSTSFEITDIPERCEVLTSR